MLNGLRKLFICCKIRETVPRVNYSIAQQKKSFWSCNKFDWLLIIWLINWLIDLFVCLFLCLLDKLRSSIISFHVRFTVAVLPLGIFRCRASLMHPGAEHCQYDAIGSHFVFCETYRGAEWATLSCQLIASMLRGWIDGLEKPTWSDTVFADQTIRKRKTMKPTSDDSSSPPSQKIIK